MELANYFIVLLQLYLATGYTYSSAPGCPQKNGIWLQDENGICHKVNTKGPCGVGMLWFPSPNKSDKIHGFCDCFDARRETEEEVEFLNDRTLTSCLDDIRSQIYVPERDRCYSAFDQGPCPEGKWLVLNSTFYPVCVKNQCAPSESEKSDPSSPRFRFAHSGTDSCYTSLTRGYCPKSYKLRFSNNDWLPKCRYSPSQSRRKCPPKRQSKEVFRSRCKPGSRRDYLSKCTQSVNPR